MSRLGDDYQNTMQCSRCHTLFIYKGYGQKLCADCNKVDQEEFDVVRGYLTEHPKSNATQVSLGTGVPVVHIIRYLKDGRLEVSADSDIYILCERCNCEIRSGRYCRNCAEELKHMLNRSQIRENEIGERPQAQTAKMHFLSRGEVTGRGIHGKRTASAPEVEKTEEKKATDASNPEEIK